jgi:putative nucleotidyltransferase with HDIG domain
MVLGTDVLSETGQVLLSNDTVLSETMIARLAISGYDSVIILEDDAENQAIRNQRISERILFNAKYGQTVTLVRNAFDEIRYFQEVPLKQMQDLSDNALVTLAATPGVLGYLHSLRNVDNYTFQHSVNVAIITAVLSKWLGYAGEQHKDFVLAGLLHDVGKAAVPLEILNKPGPLTSLEMEIMKQHPEQGGDMLRKAKVLADYVLAGVEQHHERLDGSGYPHGLRRNDIATCARVIAIADMYDAMTSERVYRRSMTPFIVIKTLFANMFDKLDAAMATVFLNNLKDYFVGSTVRLNDGRLAEVIFMDWISWDRVTVRTADGEYIQLGDRAKVQIVQCLQA